MSSQIPPLVCHTPPPIDFDADDDDDDYGSDIPEDDVIGIDERNRPDCLDDDFGDFATVLPPPAGTTNHLEPIPTEAAVIDNETEALTNIPVAAAAAAAETKGIFPPRLGSDSPPSLILPPNDYTEAGDEETAGNDGVAVIDDDEDIDFQPFGSPSQPPEPPPEDSISLPSLHFDADVSKSEEDDNLPPAQQQQQQQHQHHQAPNATSTASSVSGIETEVDLPLAAAAERTTPVIQEGGRFDDNTENDFTDFTTASNERSSVVLEVPTANDVSFELDDFAQLESTPSADSNFVSQQSRADFATFDADFSKFDSFQASFPATIDDPVPVKTPVEETKSMPIMEQAGVRASELAEDDFDDFQEFATFSDQPVVATVSAHSGEKSEPEPDRPEAGSSLASSTSTVENERKDVDTQLAAAINTATVVSEHQHEDDNVGDDDDDDDDFGEFSDFKQPEATVSAPALSTATSLPTFSMESVQKLLEAMFPSAVPEPVGTDTGQQAVAVNHIPTSKLHTQLQDFDNTSALAYQYSKSSSSKTLVTALGIDSRNIMYGPKWNSSMPRFAANLSFNPLEPLKPATAPGAASVSAKEAGSSEKSANCPPASKPVAPSSLSIALDPLQVAAVGSVSVPAAQFDWNSSGLVNPLEASHAHNTLLLDLEQLEVMASLNDKINVDSSSYFPALRSTRNVANTVQHQQHSATTTATTITTSTTPLLLPSPTVPQPPPPPRTPPPLPPQPPLSSPSPTTKQLSSLLPLPPTMHTQTYHQPYNNNNKINNDLQHPQTTKPRCANSRDTVGPGGVGNKSSTTTHSAVRSATLLFFAGSPNDDDDGDDDRDLSISAVAPLIPSATTTTTTTDTDAFDAICAATLPSCSLAANDMQSLIGFDDDDVRSRDRPQTFDDYLDLSVQEMLQKATTGQPEDGPKGEVLDPQIAENASPAAADDIAVKGSAHSSNAAASHPVEFEDVGSLDFNPTGSSSSSSTSNGSSNNSSNNAQYSVASMPQEQLPEQIEPVQTHPYVPAQQQQQQPPLSISSSPNSVPVVRTIKLPETHIFTPSRGVTPISRDITDRDIVVREYHDVEYSLEKPTASSMGGSGSGMRKECEFDEFNDFQSVPVAVPSVFPETVAISTIGTAARPVIGRSPTEELERYRPDPIGQANSGSRMAADLTIDDGDEDDEFSDFQAAVPPMVPTAAQPPVNKPISSVQSNRSVTSSPVMLLSPAILLPQQANTTMEKESANARQAASINWPDPGVDPDELARFEAAFAKPNASVTVAPPAPTVASSNQSVPSGPKPPAAVEEDEWTDFISSKPAAGSDMRQQQAASLPAGPGPTVVSETQATTQEEWTDFMSSSTTTAGSGYPPQSRLSSSQNNFNYPRTSPAVVGGAATKGAGSNSFSWANQPQLPPPQFSSWNSNSLYYNPMASLPLTNQQQTSQYRMPPQQYYNRTDMPAMAYAGSAGYSGSPKVPTNPQQQHHHHQQHSGMPTTMMMGQQQQPPMQLLPELSFITPNATGHGSAGTPGTKPATHSFLSNVISSNSFTKK